MFELHEEFNLDLVDDTAAIAAEDIIFKQKAEQKKYQVLRHIEANPNYPFWDLVKKFELSYDLVKDYGNGIGKFLFKTGQTYNDVEVMEMQFGFKKQDANILEKSEGCYKWNWEIID